MSMAALKKATARIRYEKSVYSPIDLFLRCSHRGFMAGHNGLISLEGFCIALNQAPETGSELEVKFMLPGVSWWIHARGKVTGRIDENGFRGVVCRYSGLGLGERFLISRWLGDR
jgi:hypothetical protein